MNREILNPDNPELVSVLEELPLWSAPFGLNLLELVNYKKGMNVLDIGSGLGFPMLELAQRLGTSSFVYGIDPWRAAIERINKKIEVYKIANVKIIEGMAEDLPFEDNYFELITSNNGLNNVTDLKKALDECNRTAMPGAQFIFTMNMENTMFEFYNVFADVLRSKGLLAEIEKMKEHIYKKRKPINEMEQLIKNSGFILKNIQQDSFSMRFANASAMLSHFLIRFGFLPSWIEILNECDIESVFNEVESILNHQSNNNGCMVLTIPFAAFECYK